MHACRGVSGVYCVGVPIYTRFVLATTKGASGRLDEGAEPGGPGANGALGDGGKRQREGSREREREGGTRKRDTFGVFGSMHSSSGNARGQQRRR